MTEDRREAVERLWLCSAVFLIAPAMHARQKSFFENTFLKLLELQGIRHD
jgi:hypothetical protein